MFSDFMKGFPSTERMRALLGDDWKPEFRIERVEMPKIHAIHFVVYGIFGRGISSSGRLDGFGTLAASIGDDIGRMVLERDLPTTSLTSLLKFLWGFCKFNRYISV